VSGSLLDTSVLIGPVPAAVESLPSAAAISVVSLGELHAGVLLARDEETRRARRARLQAIREAFAPLDVDEAVAGRYGEILALARSEGRTAKATDLLIIATAAAHERKLHTRDERQAGLARAAGVPVDPVP
jgi:predicted nucleic acid-binding protein